MDTSDNLPIPLYLRGVNTGLQQALSLIVQSSSLRVKPRLLQVLNSIAVQYDGVFPAFASIAAARAASLPLERIQTTIASAIQAYPFQALEPVIKQLASQRFILDGLDDVVLGLRVNQAAHAWRLATMPHPTSSELARPASIVHVGHTAASINTTAAVIEGEVVETSEEPWLVARTEAVDRIVGWLASISPKLEAKYKGMWHVVHHGGPDFVSQAANSAVELIDHVLRTLGPAEKVVEWRAREGKYANEMNPQNQRPHRSLRIRYIAAQRGLRASSIDLLIKATTGVMEDLQGMKHAEEDQMVVALTNALQGTEFCLVTLMGEEG